MEKYIVKASFLALFTSTCLNASSYNSAKTDEKAPQGTFSKKRALLQETLRKRVDSPLSSQSKSYSSLPKNYIKKEMGMQSTSSDFKKSGEEIAKKLYYRKLYYRKEKELKEEIKREVYHEGRKIIEEGRVNWNETD